MSTTVANMFYMGVALPLDLYSMVAIVPDPSYDGLQQMCDCGGWEGQKFCGECGEQAVLPYKFEYKFEYLKGFDDTLCPEVKSESDLLKIRSQRLEGYVRHDLAYSLAQRGSTKIEVFQVGWIVGGGDSRLGIGYKLADVGTYDRYDKGIDPPGFTLSHLADLEKDLRVRLGELGIPGEIKVYPTTYYG